MAHQAGADLGDDRAVTVAVAAGLVGDAQVAGVEEADELGRLLIERGVTARRVGGGPPEGAIAGCDVGGEFVGSVGAAAVAIRAGKVDGRGCVHGLDAHVALGGFALGEGGEGTEK